ncbi:MAG: phage tail tape measure C-terminal domain-containing protein [Pseudomonadota bacterium]
MTHEFNLSFDMSGFQNYIQDTQRELRDTTERELIPFSEAVEDIFDDIRREVVTELGDTILTGKLDVQDLVDDVLEDIARAWTDQFIEQSLEDILRKILFPTGGGVLGGDRSTGPIFSPPFDPACSLPDILKGNTGFGDNPLGRSTGQIASLLTQTLGRAARNA